MKNRNDNRFRRMLHVVIALGGVALLTAGGCEKRSEETKATSSIADEVVGTWFAYHNNVIENMWTFRRDGTCVNDGWPGSSIGARNPALPYHLEGTYRVSPDQITVIFTIEGGGRDTVVLKDPDISLNRLLYSSGNAPVAFLRERAAVGQQLPNESERESVGTEEIARKLIGSWVALSNGFPANTWKFKEDGTFVNEGWERMNPQTLIVRRLYQVIGRYAVSGKRVILTNEKLLQFDPETNRINAELPISESIVLYDVAFSKGRLMYTNETGLPVAFRRGTVTPTDW